jgi:RES domain-containing protein
LNAAGGIHACGGGKVNAWDLNVNTAGQHSAAIRSDRGGGTMRVDGGTYNSTGAGSPAIYSTADIAIHDATLKATGSEAASIEGKNTIKLFDCNLTGN